MATTRSHAVRLPHLSIFFPQLLKSSVLQRTSICANCLRSFSGTATRRSDLASSKLLVRLRTDLKQAMQKKDQTRLAVLRALLADITNASKTSSPITTNPQFLSLLRKRLAASSTAQSEFAAASRQDLVDKEKAQEDVLQAYAHELQGDAPNADAIRQAVEEAIQSLDKAKQNVGLVMKNLVGPGGKLEGQALDGKELARAVKSVLDGRKS